MTTDEMIADLQSLLGKIGTVVDSEILVELKLAQTQVERGPILPWFLLEERFITLTADEPRVEIPSNFLRESEQGGLYYVPTAGTFELLEKQSLDTLRPEYEGEDQGAPEFYALHGKYFWIYPVPDEAYTVRQNYYAKDVVLATGDSGNFWSTYYPDLLMGLAGQNLCSHMQKANPADKARFDEMVLVARQQMNQDENAREMANHEGEMGGG